jgi:hypothetical protein
MHVSVVKHDLLPLTPHSPTPTPPHTQTSAIGPRDSWGKCSLGKYSLGSRLTSCCIWWVLFVSRDCKFACQAVCAYQEIPSLLFTRCSLSSSACRSLTNCPTSSLPVVLQLASSVAEMSSSALSNPMAGHLSYCKRVKQQRWRL